MQELPARSVQAQPLYTEEKECSASTRLPEKSRLLKAYVCTQVILPTSDIIWVLVF